MTQETRAEFGAVVRSHRSRSGLTQEELAERAGLGLRTIRMIETARVQVPRQATVRRLADVFGLCGAARAEFHETAARGLVPPSVGGAGRSDPAPPSPAPHGGTAIEAATRSSLRDDGERIHPPPAQLPPVPAGFVGRADSIARLDELLDQLAAGRSTVVAVVAGTAGIGKTMLAFHWAGRVAQRFPDGQLYLNLRGFGPAFAPMSVAEGSRLLLDALGVPGDRIPANVESQLGLYRSLLAGRRMLVVLDNARDAEQVRPLLPGGSGCFALVTSRNQLAGLAAVDGATLLPLDVLSADEAHELLVRRLGGRRVADEPGPVADIVLASSRLPLAVAVIAARAAAAPSIPLAVVASDLHSRRNRLDALTTDDARSNVRTVFSWSYNALQGGAARAFRLLGRHPGPDISVDAAAILLGNQVPDAAAILAELVQAHLLTRLPSGRYGMHDLLRAYASDLARSLDPVLVRQGGPHPGEAARIARALTAAACTSVAAWRTCPV